MQELVMHIMDRVARQSRLTSTGWHLSNGDRECTLNLAPLIEEPRPSLSLRRLSLLTSPMLPKVLRPTSIKRCVI